MGSRPHLYRESYRITAGNFNAKSIKSAMHMQFTKDNPLVIINILLQRHANYLLIRFNTWKILVQIPARYGQQC
jgi:hypothetical protein